MHSLGNKTRPSTYDIKLNCDFEALTFTGECDICVSITGQTSELTFNACELDNLKITAFTGKGEIAIKAVIPKAEDEAVQVVFENAVSDEVRLKISYNGQINDKLRGFYRFKPSIADSNFSFYGSTHFEATGARYAFPCWDAPSFRAKFKLSFCVDSRMQCFSNMPIEKSESSGSKTTHCFQETPVMPTYLVGWSMGLFDVITSKTSKNVPVSILTPLGQKHLGQFALEVATKSLDFYGKFFKIDFPLPKIDLIAIADFPIGAMENWGLVTFKETALLCSDAVALRAKQYVAIVVAHELAHMWFGNYVTIEWWNDLWLKEGFASFMEFICIDECFPHFKIMDLLTELQFCRALSLDCQVTSHPIEMPVRKPSEIDNIFDAISYAKGASVIHMMYDYLGRDEFADALNLYLTKYQYGCARTELLWECLSAKTSKIIVADVMPKFTQRVGYPLLQVSIENNSVVMRQSEFKLPPGKETTEGNVWPLPLRVNIGDKTDVYRKVMQQKEEKISLENAQKDVAVIVNPSAATYCRVVYSDELLTHLSKLVSARDQRVSGAYQMYLLSNLLEFGKASTCPLELGPPLLFLKAVCEAADVEDGANFNLWSYICSSVGSYIHFGELCGAPLVKFFSDVLVPLYDGVEIAAASPDVMSWLLLIVAKMLEHPAALERCRKIVDTFISNLEQTSSDAALLPTAMNATCYHTEDVPKMMETLLSLYAKETVGERREIIVRGLASLRATEAKHFDRLYDALRMQDFAGLAMRLGSREAATFQGWLSSNAAKIGAQFEKTLLVRHVLDAGTRGAIEENLVHKLKQAFDGAGFEEHRVMQACFEKGANNARILRHWIDTQTESALKFINAK